MVVSDLYRSLSLPNLIPLIHQVPFMYCERSSPASSEMGYRKKNYSLLKIKVPQIHYEYYHFSKVVVCFSSRAFFV